MAMTRRAITIFLYLIPLIVSATAAAAGTEPGSLALALSDLSAKEARDLSRDELLLSAMESGFARLGGLSAIPRDRADAARRGLFILRSFDSDSIADALALGRRLRVEAVAVASVAVVEETVALTLRLYETEGGRRIAADSSSGSLSDLPARLESGMRELCAAWAERGALTAAPASAGEPRSAREVAAGGTAVDLVVPAKPAHAAGAIARDSPLELSFLAGYSSVAAMNWEIEAAPPALPLSFGLEFTYERRDLIAELGDVLSLSLLGRWWPLDGVGKKSLMLALGAGGSVDTEYGLQAGPFRFSAGWRFALVGDLGPFRLARPLRLQPELGISWSTRPRWRKEYIDIIGLLPYAGLKIGL